MLKPIVIEQRHAGGCDRVASPAKLEYAHAVLIDAEAAQLKRWTCGMTITKGGCPMPVYLPEPPKPQRY